MSDTSRSLPPARTPDRGDDPQGGATPNDPNTGESPKERIDRELIELLNELRVILPGIQVLFAFLLTVPFSQRFTQVNGPDKAAFFAAVLCTAASTIALVTVPNYHRLTFRQATKERLIFVANGLTLVGTAFLGIAMVAVLFLIADFLYDGVGVVAVTVVTAVVIVGLWFLMPLTSRARHRLQDTAKGGGHLT